MAKFFTEEVFFGIVTLLVAAATMIMIVVTGYQIP